MTERPALQDLIQAYVTFRDGFTLNERFNYAFEIVKQADNQVTDSLVDQVQALKEICGISMPASPKVGVLQELVELLEDFQQRGMPLAEFTDKIEELYLRHP